MWSLRHSEQILYHWAITPVLQWQRVFYHPLRIDHSTVTSLWFGSLQTQLEAHKCILVLQEVTMHNRTKDWQLRRYLHKMHNSPGCSSAHSINDLGDPNAKSSWTPETPATQTALFCICMNKKAKYVYFLLQKERFQDTFMQGRKCFPFRNSEANATKPQASLTSTRLAGIAVPLGHGGKSPALFSLLERCMHEFLLWKVIVHGGLCMMRLIRPQRLLHPKMCTWKYYYEWKKELADMIKWRILILRDYPELSVWVPNMITNVG